MTILVRQMPRSVLEPGTVRTVGWLSLNSEVITFGSRSRVSNLLDSVKEGAEDGDCGMELGL